MSSRASLEENLGLIHRLFPQYDHSHWTEICFAYWAEQFFPHTRFTTNPLLDPLYCNRWMKTVTAIKGATHSYGGLYELRNQMWRGSYITPDKSTHLGIDYNVPVNQPVYCPVPGRVVDVWFDEDQNGGWGGRVIVEAIGRGVHMVFGHLRHEGLPYRLLGREIGQGQIVGWIADYEETGGWWPHLHLHCMRGDLPADFRTIDGYGGFVSGLEQRHPDPALALR
jgi:murein DD-endopeptidase MepM/ murein hydrolase activator NlpD